MFGWRRFDNWGKASPFGNKQQRELERRNNVRPTDLIISLLVVLRACVLFGRCTMWDMEAVLDAHHVITVLNE